MTMLLDPPGASTWGYGVGLLTQQYAPESPPIDTHDDQHRRWQWSLRSVLGKEVVVKGAGDHPSWLAEVIAELQRLLHLNHGWDSYVARPVSPYAAVRGLNLLFEALPGSGPAPQLVPMSDGGLQMEWHLRGLNVEVSVPPTGDVEVWSEDLRSGDEQETTLDRTPEILGDLLGELVRRS